jgi:glycosyltransferase involved in cell wall biosynthesis
MSARVTIAIPVFRRLHYLPGVLKAVALQEYDDIELIVSDNGQNGNAVRDIVAQHYSRPYRFRQTKVTVDIPAHYHEVLAEAGGEYFVWLADDDLIGATFVSDLVPLLEKDPDVAVAIACQEVIDTSGRVLRRSSDRVPERLSGEDFIESWTAFGYENYSTVLARTRDVRQCGGYGNFPSGTASDDALLIKLCLRGAVAFSTRCTFQYRWHESSYGLAMSPDRLAADIKLFLKFLDTDAMIQTYARRHPKRWRKMRRRHAQMMCEAYLYRWKAMYRGRLSTRQWLRAAFAMPLIPSYYRALGGELWKTATAPVVGRLKARL